MYSSIKVLKFVIIINFSKFGVRGVRGLVSGSLVGRGGVGGSFVGRGGVRRGGVGRSLVSWGRVRRSGVGRSGVGRSGVSGCLVDWGLVGSSFVFLLLNVLGVLGLSFVFHISGVSVLISLVGDDLSATIGEGNAVRSSGNFVVGFLRVVEVNVGLAILNVKAEAVGLGSL